MEADRELAAMALKRRRSLGQAYDKTSNVVPFPLKHRLVGPT